MLFRSLKPVHLLLPLLATAFVPTAFADTSPTPATDPRIEHLLSDQGSGKVLPIERG